ncbi:hypothetical protein CROQUDRAFT_49517 [Cronartium quercuum f. sp. fusiforme G11]|uniref:Uncharacterized protein n=1 Tax=Cronartium quercuum f. sp. fusiforme G11 TaxID=708437 RepID=A0A9P6NEV5_9BASI|nr:hypothetical protein CROQUDRAFT_49517 [Cronartium quercuum f. sp. fusiforme G11]
MSFVRLAFLALSPRLEKLRAAREEAKLASEKRAAENKTRFDSQFDPGEDGKVKSVLTVYKIADRVKLRNESHTKGEPHWFGPFEIFDSLGKNVYTLVNPDGSLFPHPISGNRLKTVNVKDISLGKPWALPPRLLQEIRRSDLKLSKDLSKKLSKLTNVQQAIVPKIKIVGHFAQKGSTSAV